MSEQRSSKFQIALWARREQQDRSKKLDIRNKIELGANKRRIAIGSQEATGGLGLPIEAFPILQSTAHRKRVPCRASHYLAVPKRHWAHFRPTTLSLETSRITSCGFALGSRSPWQDHLAQLGTPEKVRSTAGQLVSAVEAR
jgi:hypothetical protein